MECSDPGSISLGSKVPAQGPYYEGVQLNYTCNAGYETSDGRKALMMTCQSSNLWSPTDKPTCTSKAIMWTLEDTDVSVYSKSTAICVNLGDITLFK